MRIVTALSATALSAGLVLTGVQVAGADSGSITLPGDGYLAQRVTKYCARVPALIERADQATTRLSGSASTKGSIAWLQAKQATAEQAGRPKVSAHLGRVIARREDRLTTLPQVKTNLAKAQSECSSLNLPAPSSTTPAPAAS